MKITKLGHCCLLIETNGVRIVTDPGNYSTAQDAVTDIDFIVISHEHTDHLHIESVKNLLKNNPQAKIITNASVGKILTKENIPFSVVAHSQSADLKGVSLKGWGTKHAVIYKMLEDTENTGYVFAEKFFYPGDAFTPPNMEIEILALPVAGPWMKLSEAIEYALLVKPKKCFPVHDENLKTYGISHRLPGIELPKSGIEFIPCASGQTLEFN